jgi:cytidylate kinase
MKTPKVDNRTEDRGQRAEDSVPVHSPSSVVRPPSSGSLVVTIDGPAGSGKSTVSRLLAERIGAAFLDTGAMYRAITWAALLDGVDLEDPAQLVSVMDRHHFQFELADGVMQAAVDGVDVTRQIRDPALTASVHHVAACPPMRHKLVEMQRQFASGFQRIVTEGRDQGTVAFPDANVKFYLVADTSERARRRQAELRASGQKADFEQIREAIEARDRSDEQRSVGPLKPAGDAILVDTTELTVEQVVERLLAHICGQEKGDTGKEGREEGKKEPDGSDRLPVRASERNGGSGLRESVLAAWYSFARFLCRVFCMLFFKLRIFGSEHIPADGPVIVASNHQSFMDPVFCGVGAPRRLVYMARDSLFSFGPFGWLLRSVNAIPISRDKPDISTMRAVIERLRKGEAVCLFPEGTRTSDGRIAPFKSGFGLLCRRGGATVVPVLVEGAFECWPRHKKLFNPGSLVIVRFGKPLTPEQVKTMSNEQLADHITHVLRQMQNQSRAKQGKEPFDYSHQSLG